MAFRAPILRRSGASGPSPEIEPQIAQIAQMGILFCAICAICGSKTMVEVLGCGFAALPLCVFIAPPDPPAGPHPVPGILPARPERPATSQILARPPAPNGAASPSAKDFHFRGVFLN